MSKTLEERLAESANSFSGLLSLLPAKYYYDEDTQDQWSRKKQTKEQSKENRRAKFDPDSLSTAKDVSEALQNQIEEEDEDDEGGDESEDDEEEEKAIEKKAPMPNDIESKTPKSNDAQNKKPSQKADDDSDSNEISIVFDDQGNEIADDDNETDQNQSQPENKTTPSKKAGEEKSQSRSNSPGVQELRDKLQNRIQQLREKRKAPGSNANGAPLNREAILEARREKQAANKAKKDLKRKREEEEEEEEQQGDAEEDDGVDNDNTTATADTKKNYNLVYSQVEFNDGKLATSDLKEIKKQKQKKQRDLVGQLKHVEARNSKLSKMDPEKQKAIQEKTQWNRALQHASGEKVRDDEKMLRKSVKQQNKKKKKSEREWKERKKTVERNIKARQVEREKNLKERREMKGIKGKKAKKRAGFEGSKKSKKATR